MTVNNTDTHDTIQMSPKSMSSVNSNPSFRMNQPFNTNSNNYSTSYSRNYDNNYRIANNRNMNSSPKFSPSSYSQAPQNKNRFNNNQVRNNKQEFSKYTNDNSRRKFQNQQSYSSNNNYSRQHTANTINPSYTSTGIEPLQESVLDISFTETSSDGVVSGKKAKKPSKSSLIFFTTLVNNYKTKILIDTGATTTFINEKLLNHINQSNVIHRKSYSFVLADGITPFQVLRTVKLSLQFANIITTIETHIVRNLCTNIILGMDYINLYNLSFDVKHQTISIEYRKRLLTMNIEPGYKLKRISVIPSKSLYIPPKSTRSSKVNIPISTLDSYLVPNQYLHRNKICFDTHTLVNFRNYCSSITFSNTSSFPRHIRKGYCIGFLLCRSLPQSLSVLSTSVLKSLDVTRFP
ncbi:unnamed protein product, partial [Rotaria magnacalcarata]